MKTILTIIAAALALAAAIAPASSADLGGPKIAAPAAIVVAHKSPFAGAYIGAHAGYSQMADESAFNGWSGGGLAGYAAEINGLIVGAEIDGTLSAAGFRTTENDVAISIANDWIVSMRGKLGIEVGNVMPYATAGIAWARFSGRATDGVATETTGATDRLWVIGGGIDYAVPATNLIIGLGILHYFDTAIADGMTTARGSLSVKLN